MGGLFTAAVLGLLLGVRHAFEPDHLAAVSTLLAERPTRHRAFWLGGAWGLGHTASLLVAGGVLFALRIRMPPALEDGFELVVALMLVALGLLALRRLFASEVSRAHRPGLARRSLLVGMTHGFAGSGALTALAMATMPTAWSCLAYIGLFGLGSAVGMSMMTGLAGGGLQALGARRRLERGILATAAVASLGLGIVWGVPRALRLMHGNAPVAAAPQA